MFYSVIFGSFVLHTYYFWAAKPTKRNQYKVDIVLVNILIINNLLFYVHTFLCLRIYICFPLKIFRVVKRKVEPTYSFVNVFSNANIASHLNIVLYKPKFNRVYP